MLNVNLKGILQLFPCRKICEFCVMLIFNLSSTKVSLLGKLKCLRLAVSFILVLLVYIQDFTLVLIGKNTSTYVYLLDICFH